MRAKSLQSSFTSKLDFPRQLWKEGRNRMGVSFYLLIYLMWTSLSFYQICYSIISVLCFGFLAARYVGSWLPDCGSYPQPPHCEAKS